jgi:pyridoxamine 5'-phosphate oxidase-like protein
VVVSQRAEVKMSDDEVKAFLLEERTVVCASNGVRGWPHVTPLWYLPRGLEIWCWTYEKSQKTRNLERDPRATLQIEAGQTYDDLRGAVIEAEAVLHRERDVKFSIGAELAARYDARRVAAVRAQLDKRVVIQFVPQRVMSWDHRRLVARHA